MRNWAVPSEGRTSPQKWKRRVGARRLESAWRGVIRGEQHHLVAHLARALEELQRAHVLALAPMRWLGLGDAGMSVQAMAWAIEQQYVTDPTARHVLIVLASYAGKTGRGAYPSVGTLARGTGLSERTVQLKLKQLLTSGLIAFGNQGIAEVDLEGNPRRNGYRVNVYDLNLGLQARGEGAAPLRGESDGAAGANLAQSRGEGAAPDPRALKALSKSKATQSHTRDVTAASASPAPVEQCLSALADAGFVCTSKKPELIAYLESGGTAEHLRQVAFLPACTGKSAGYAIAIARRELCELSQPVRRSHRRNTALHPRVCDDFSTVKYQGTPPEELPPALKDAADEHYRLATPNAFMATIAADLRGGVQ